MFRRKKDITKNEDFYSILQLVCKGETEFFIETIKNTGFVDVSFIEYALAYGRYEILEYLLNDDYYKKILNDNTYNPFELSNCSVDIPNDVHDGSYWSNDEHERCVVNYYNIDHKRCFEMLEAYNKNIVNIREWILLTENNIYYSKNNYFPDEKLLLETLLKHNNIVFCIKNVIEALEGVVSENTIIKIVTKIFSKSEILDKLRN